MSFDGTADYTLDSKNRLTVPARYRDDLGQTVVLAMGVEPCLALWPQDGYSEFKRSVLGTVHPASEKAQKMKRFFAANSQPAELTDKAGRVMVPPFLMEYAGLSRDVTVIGADDHLEIWDRARWAAYNADLAGDMRAIARAFDEVAA